MFLLLGNRFGFLVTPLVLFSQLGVSVIANAYFGPWYFERHPWTWAFGFFVSAGVCWLLGRTLRRRQPPPVTVDPKTGREPAVGSAAYARYVIREMEKEGAFNIPRDSFFFLHIVYWAPVLAAIGLAILLVRGFGLH